MVGKGGFGDVFHVKISVKGKPKLECAVKRLIGGESDKEMRKQFEAEVDTMKEWVSLVHCATHTQCVQHLAVTGPLPSPSTPPGSHTLT